PERLARVLKRRQYPPLRSGVRGARFVHSFLQWPKYPPWCPHPHTLRRLHNSASELHRWRYKPRNVPPHAEPLGFLFRRSRFLKEFCRGIQKYPLRELPFFVWENREPPLFLPIRLLANRFRWARLHAVFLSLKVISPPEWRP